MSYEPMKEANGGGYQQQLPAYQTQPQPVPSHNVQMQPVQPVVLQTVPEVQHHSNELSEEDTPRDNSDNDSDDGYDPKSPGDVPQKYLNLEFEACFHEHKKTMTIKPVHKVLGIIYKWIKLITYHSFVFIIGIPLMIIWAFINGIMAFIYSWMWSPALRLSIFWLAAAIPLVTMPLVAIFKPLIDVSARIFRQIRLKAKLDGQLYEQPHIV